MSRLQRSANVNPKDSHQMHHLLTVSLTMAKDHDTMTWQGPPLKSIMVKVHLITAKALTATREVEVQKEKEDVMKIEMKLIMMSLVEKSRISEKEKHVLLRAAEGQGIQQLSNTMMCIIKTVIEVKVVVDLLMWTEDIAEIEEILMMTLRSTGIKERRMNILSTAVENTSERVKKIDRSMIKVVDGGDGTVAKIEICLTQLFCSFCFLVPSLDVLSRYTAYYHCCVQFLPALFFGITLNLPKVNI